MEITDATTGIGLGSGTGGSQNVFLDLVVKELQYQDPLEPVSNTDFLAQLAQFSTLEQMEALNTNLNQQALFERFGTAANIVGKDATYVDPQTGDTKSGRVDSVLIQGSAVYADINGEAIPIDNVIQVFATEDDGDTPRTDENLPPDAEDGDPESDTDSDRQ